MAEQSPRPSEYDLAPLDAPARNRPGAAAPRRAATPNTPPSAAGLPFALVLIGVFALAFAVRLVHLSESRGLPFFESPISDAQVYDLWARRIVAGDWLGNEVFHQAPLYPCFLGLLYKLLGRDLWWARVVQIALGSAGCAFVAAGARRWLSAPVGAAAGLLLALYPPAIFADGLIQKTVLDGLLGAALVWLLAVVRPRPTAARMAGVGLLLGLLGLSRENALLFVPLVALWAALRPAGGAAPRIARATACLLGAALMLAPVVIRNGRIAGEYTLTTWRTGPNFYYGNNPHATGLYVPLRPGRGDAAFERRDAIELAERAVGRALAPREVSRYWFGQAWQFIARQPADWLRLLGRKLMLTLNAYEVPDAEDQYFYERSCRLLRTLDFAWHFGLLLPLAGAGLVLARPRWRDLWILIVLAAAVIAGVTLFFVFARYRYPAVALLMPFAALAVVEIAGRLRSGRAATLVPAGLVGISLGVLANWPMMPRTAHAAASLANAGQSWANLGDWNAAIDSYRTAARLDPRLLTARVGLGLTLRSAGRVDEALSALLDARLLAPDDPAVLTEIARTHLALMQMDAAEEALRAALAAWPGYPDAVGALGVVEFMRGRPADGLERARQARRAAPRDPRLARDLAMMLALCADESLRDPHAAAALAEEALALSPDDDPELRDALAIVYSECGRFDDALAQARTALATARARRLDTLAGRIEGQIHSFELHIPFRQAPGPK
ncbi:MAG: tetratricopeptide repeat protein [Phycisphaerae bacterium]